MADGDLWALGLMSGTSMDGVDAALLRTDGAGIAAFGPTAFRPYGDAERAAIRRALAEAPALADRTARPGPIGEAETVVTRAHAAIVAEMLERAAREGIAVDVVGFHGQTVFHAPDRGLTVQIGDGPELARAAGIAVVHDFRAADVAAGGEGAPLVPVYHRALAAFAGLALPAAFLNIGGVANVTLIGADGALLAFDTGPGNAVIDDIVFAETGARFDRDGRIAARGRVDAATVAAIVAGSDYLARPPPKSLDRNAFTAAQIPTALAFEDRVATAVEVVAETVRMALQGREAASVVVCGGGARNARLLDRIARRTGRPVVTAATIGLDPDFIEAQAFAYLAARRIRGLESTYPTTTGVAAPVVAGVVTRP